MTTHRVIYEAGILTEAEEGRILELIDDASELRTSPKVQQAIADGRMKIEKDCAPIHWMTA